MTISDIENLKNLEALERSLRVRLDTMIESRVSKSDLIAKSKEYSSAYFAVQNSWCKFVSHDRDGH